MSLDYVALLHKAQAHVRASVLWKRFIDGTPLENDIAVWMTEFAIEAVKESDGGASGSSLDLQRLVAFWRDVAGQPSLECPDCEGVMKRCADELEAALRALPASQQVKANEISSTRVDGVPEGEHGDLPRSVNGIIR